MKMKITPKKANNERLVDQYMSQSELGNDELNNFELNSNVSVNMLPNHGYTSGFTDGI
jgi:hypothetical protein